MQVSHVEKNMVEQSGTVPNSQSIGSTWEYLGLDLINPQSSLILWPLRIC